MKNPEYEESAFNVGGAIMMKRKCQKKLLCQLQSCKTWLCCCSRHVFIFIEFWNAAIKMKRWVQCTDTHTVLRLGDFCLLLLWRSSAEKKRLVAVSQRVLIFTSRQKKFEENKAMEYIHAGVSFMDGFTMTHQGRGTSVSKCKIKCQRARLPVLRHAS